MMSWFSEEALRAYREEFEAWAQQRGINVPESFFDESGTSDEIFELELLFAMTRPLRKDGDHASEGS